MQNGNVLHEEGMRKWIKTLALRQTYSKPGYLGGAGGIKGKYPAERSRHYSRTKGFPNATGIRALAR